MKYEGFEIVCAQLPIVKKASPVTVVLIHHFLIMEMCKKIMMWVWRKECQTTSDYGLAVQSICVTSCHWLRPQISATFDSRDSGMELPFPLMKNIFRDVMSKKSAILPQQIDNNFSTSKWCPVYIYFTLLRNDILLLLYSTDFVF